LCGPFKSLLEYYEKKNLFVERIKNSPDDLPVFKSDELPIIE
jgi:hypothetical protein